MAPRSATARKAKPRTEVLYGSERPRIAPPTPACSALEAFEKTAAECGLALIPWQRTAARYLTALAPDDRWLYGEVAIIVARQNGKTTILIPAIVDRLKAGRRIMHTAQNRELPREVHLAVADILEAKYPQLVRSIRFANGQEEIRLVNGGHYRIVAPTRGGARGPSNDDVIVDELREMEDFGFIAAAKPTLTASRNPQIIYLSNAGTDDSAVLNALTKRADEDPKLAYLEWSAAPDRAPDDVKGWLEANPSIGHIPPMLGYLTDEYRANMLGDSMPVFETEHLCRRVVTLAEPLVDAALWDACKADDLERPVRPPVLGLSMDQSGRRASAVLAWMQSDNSVAVRLMADVTGDPVIDLDAFGPALRTTVARMGPKVRYDPYDEQLARFFRGALPMNGREYANASGAFVRLLQHHGVRWQGCEAVSADLRYATRRWVGPQAFMAVKARDDEPITALLAAIRAIGAAVGPKPSAPRVY